MKKIFLKYFSQEELLSEITKRFYDDSFVSELSKEEMQTIFSDMTKVENIEELFKNIMKMDRIRYFNAPDKQSQDIVRGAFSRTLWILKSLKKINVEQSEIAAAELSTPGRTATIV